jgi:uncharacterized membrane protein YdjX (TVP38/TMEM64 family)
VKDEGMSEMSEPARRRGALHVLPLVAILGVALVGAFTLRDWLSFETLAANREALIALRDANYLAAVGLFMAAYVTIVAFSLPGATLATLTGGFLFGTFPGVFVNVTAATLGATVIFLAARWGFGERLAARMDESQGAIHRIKQGIDENQWSALFLIRLVPLIPFFVANLVPAMLGVPLRRFVISTWLGIMPGAFVYTSAGAGLGAVFDAGDAPDLGVIFTPPVLIPLIGLAALAALPMLLKLRRHARRA